MSSFLYTASAQTAPAGEAGVAAMDVNRNVKVALASVVAGTTVAITASAAIPISGTVAVSILPSAQIPATLGPKAPASSISVVPAVLTPYRLSASVSTTAFGATGAAGDYMSHVILQPAATNAGTTTIFNNSTTVYVYTAGTLADLRPIVVPINAQSSGGSWNATTGASMTATGFGTFT